jgi:hypothetical protein
MICVVKGEETSLQAGDVIPKRRGKTAAKLITYVVKGKRKYT